MNIERMGERSGGVGVVARAESISDVFNVISYIKEERS